jgi:putative colanic acid biosynthesis glycosyltransferase
MKNDTYLSVICATYNAEKVITGFIKSIKEQSLSSGFEIVFMDGGSTDGTLKKINEAKLHNVVLVSEPDKGIYNAFNKAVKIARGKWVIFIGADDKLYSPDTLLKLSNFLREHESADLVYGKVLVGLDGNIVYKPKFNSKLLLINSIHHQGAIYKKELFRDFFYNETYKISSDYELNLLLFLNKSKAVFYDEFISIVEEHGISQKVLKNGYDEEIYIRTKYLKNKAVIFFLNKLTLLRYFLKKYPLASLRNHHLIHRI